MGGSVCVYNGKSLWRHSYCSRNRQRLSGLKTATMRACVLWILSGLLCLGCAERDKDMSQRMVDISLPVEQREEGDEDMYQREIDLSFPMQQREVDLPFLIQGEPIITPRGRRPAPVLSNNLNNFPPGKPTRANIANICRKTRTIVSYGPENLPQTGFSHLSRQGHAMNRVEEGYARCCSQSEKLRCALEVWKNGMDAFCENEFSVKTRHYHCCKKRDVERETCFRDEAPNPNYIISAPLLEVGSADIPSVPGPRSLKLCSSQSSKCGNNPEGKYRLTDLAFPPGEPKSSNIENICKLRKFRPLYTDNKLPNSAFGNYVRRAKAIYRAESEFKKCCKTEDLGCAHSGWQKALSKFCAKELEVKSKHYDCCKKRDQASMFRCFASEAPFPEYDKEVENLNLSNITESILEKVCMECKLLTKQKQLPLLISGLKDSCCSLPHDKKLVCAQEQKEKFMHTLCGPKKESWKDTQNCCSKDDQEREDCFGFYLENISMVISHRIKEE